MSNHIDDDIDGTTITLPKNKTKKPSMYTVVFLNDDFTPMDFVVKAIVSVFYVGLDEAVNLMMKVHKEGKASVGSFTYEVAETKAMQVMDLAKKDQHPLQVFPEQLS